jgi:hypothetical protein
VAIRSVFNLILIRYDGKGIAEITLDTILDHGHVFYAGVVDQQYTGGMSGKLPINGGSNNTWGANDIVRNVFALIGNTIRVGIETKPVSLSVLFLISY